MSTKPVIQIEKGVRTVKPYFFEHRAAYRPRWHGHTAAAVLCAEFGQSPEVVRKDIQQGSIYVTTGNGKAGGPAKLTPESTLTHSLQPQDAIFSLLHVHEPRVRLETALGAEIQLENLPEFLLPVSQFPAYTTASGIPVIHETSDMLAVSKPAGIPTHPGGIYRHNTLSEILRHDLGYQVWPCHRLDKLTSGVLLLAKSTAACKKYMGLLQQKDRVQKYYFAQVSGEFPAGTFRYTCPVFLINSSGGYVNGPDSVSLDSTTHFQRVGYSPTRNQSLVLCRPITGRMHQIRIHLRNLGYPIANDGFYNAQEGPNAMKNALEKELYDRLYERHPQASKLLPIPGLECLTDVTNLPISVRSLAGPHFDSQLAELANSRATADALKSNANCEVCSRPLYDTTPDTGIWLHAFILDLCGAEHEFPRITSPPPQWFSAL